MKKNYLKNLLPALTMLLCSVTASAHDFEVDGIYYNINGNEVSVSYMGDYSYYEKEYSGDVVIPETVTYNGKTYSVTSIGSNAFSDCDGLTSITIPSSVISIGRSAFYGCTGLTSITIPNSVTSIGERAFYVTAWYKNQPDGVVYAGKVLYEYKGTMPSGTSINIKEGTLGITGNAFYYCTGLTSITIPNSVTSIGSGAFRDCTGLTSVTIGNSVTSIGRDAFYGCTGLTSITIPNSVTSIESSAFEGCTGLTSITIPNSVTSIGECAFRDCSGLTSIVVENGNTVYDSRNNCNAIIETKTNTLISGCKNTIIPEDVTSIEGYAFYGCHRLTSITIPNSVTSIGSSAFSGCSGLTSVTIGNSVTSIGDGAFSYCYDLTSITIPNSVTSIGDYAFYDCSGLTSIYSLGETPVAVFSLGLDSVCYENAVLYVPQGSLDAYKAASGWKEFKNIVEFDPTGIEDVAEDVVPAFEITDGGIKFTDAEGKAVAVYSTAGALVEKIDSYAGEEITLGKGVYIVRVGDKAVKVKL